MKFHFAKSGNLYRTDDLAIAVENNNSKVPVYKLRTIAQSETCSSLAVANFVNGSNNLSPELRDVELLVSSILAMRNKEFVTSFYNNAEDVEFIVEKGSLSAVALLLCGCSYLRDYPDNKEVYSINWG